MTKNKNALLEQTQQYWLLSSSWNNRIDTAVTTQEALLHLKGIMLSLNPRRPLVKAAGFLLASIITPKRLKKRRNLPKPIPLKQQTKTIA